MEDFPGANLTAAERHVWFGPRPDATSARDVRWSISSHFVHQWQSCAATRQGIATIAMTIVWAADARRMVTSRISDPPRTLRRGFELLPAL